MIHHITRATRHLIFWSLITAALGLTVIRILLSEVDGYKNQVAEHIGKLMDAPVIISHIRAKMRGFSPELVLSGIDIESELVQKSAIKLEEIRVGLNLLDAIIYRDLLSSSSVTLVGAKLTVKRKADGSIGIVGLKASDEKPTWLLQGRKYEVLRSDVIWQDEKNNKKPIKFTSIDMAIINDGNDHRINILANLPKSYGELLRLSMNLKGNVLDAAAVSGSIYAEGKQIKPAGFIDSDLPHSIKINSGKADFQLWSNWQKSQPVSLRGNVQFQPLKLVRQNSGTLAIKNMATHFDWQQSELPVDSGNNWRLDLKQLNVEIEHANKNESRTALTGGFHFATKYNNEELIPNVGVSIEQLDLKDASVIAEFFGAEDFEQFKTLKQAQLQGRLESFKLFTDRSANKTALEGKFTRLSFAPQSGIPGIENLSGDVKGTENVGVIQLATDHANFNADLFREAINISKLHGKIAWRQTPESWLVSGEDLAMDSPDIQTKSKFQLEIPKKDSSAVMNIQSSFAIDDVTKVPHYLPTKIMRNSLVDWLDHAFIAGRLTAGHLNLSGKLDEFPFAGAEGVFETVFVMEESELLYNPEWPNLTGLKGEVLFFKDALKITLLEGQSNKIKIKQAEVAIEDLAKGEQLLVKGELESGIVDALSFLQQTPLKKKIDPVLDAITPQGDTHVTLDLKLPLLEGGKEKVDGTAELKNAKLIVKAIDLPVNDVNGLLKFNERGISSDVIHANSLASPIQINIKNNEQNTTVNVTGNATVNVLKKQFKLPWWDLAAGSSDYFIQLKLPNASASEDKTREPELIIQSSLSGIALDLPEMLRKPKQQKNPSTLKFTLVDKGKLLPLELNYDNKLKAAVKINSENQSLYSGHLLIGDGAVEQRQDAGLKIEINRDQLELQDCLKMAAANQQADAVNSIREIKIHSDHAVWDQTQLGGFDLSLQHESDQWQGHIGSVFASGKIKIPTEAKKDRTIFLDMDLLDFSALKQLKFKENAEAQQISPETIPLFNLSSQKTLWKSLDLGQLKLETSRLPQGIAFSRIDLTAPDKKLSLTGDWTFLNKQSKTSTKGKLEIPKAGQFFADLGISKDLAETNAAFDFTFNWNAAPYQLDLAILQGQVDVKLKNGRILSIEPGFGRVLGVLAMAQWMKRLQLDFRDVFQEGLTFNSIKGHFDLLAGKATTNNLVVDAVPAKITITGSTDLIARTLDHIVNVAPKSADAVPIAGTIVGKVANLLARSITGNDQDGLLFGSQYLVKGKWGDVQITPLHENDGLLQKTWNGITDFPWLEQKKQ